MKKWRNYHLLHHIIYFCIRREDKKSCIHAHKVGHWHLMCFERSYEITIVSVSNWAYIYTNIYIYIYIYTCIYISIHIDINIKIKWIQYNCKYRLKYKAYKYALSILPQRAKFFLISLLQYGFWYVNIKTAMHVLICALRNISPSELKYDFFHIWC